MNLIYKAECALVFVCVSVRYRNPNWQVYRNYYMTIQEKKLNKHSSLLMQESSEIKSEPGEPICTHEFHPKGQTVILLF